MCILRPQTGQVRSRTSSFHREKPVCSGHWYAILPTSVIMNQPSVPETSPHVTSGIHGFLALCRAVVFEAVADPVVVKVEARLPQVAQDGGRGDIVQVGADAGIEQLGLGYAWRKRIIDAQ